MLKKLLVLAGLLACVTTLFAAGVKWSAKTKLAAATGDDLVVVVNDPNGTPVSYAVGRDEFLLDWTGSSSIALLGTVATGQWNGTAVAVPYGGTGATTLTDGGILLGSGTGAITALGAAASGQIPIGDGTTDPVLATITGTADEIDVTNGAGAITLSLPSTIVVDVTGDLTGTASTATTALTALAGDSATAFFPTGTIENERGGLEADVSGYVNGLFGMIASATADIDTIGELETALGGENVLTATEGDAAYQPLEATLTDIADGTITEDLVNTANPWADNEVADDITAGTAATATAIADKTVFEDGGVLELAITAGMMNIGTGASPTTFWRGDNTWAAVASNTAYGGTWNGDLEPPSKNAVYDVIEGLPINGNLTGDVTSVGVATDIDESVLAVGGSDTVFPAPPASDKALAYNFAAGTLDWADVVDVTLTAGSVLVASGTTEVASLGVLGDGSIIVGDGVTTPVTLAAFTSSTGTLKHESGGLEADVSGYSGLLAVSSGTTSEVDTFAELDTQIADKELVNKADGATWTGTHDYSGATTVPWRVSTTATPTVEGRAVWESDTDELTVGDGTNSIVVAAKTNSRSFVIANIDTSFDFPFWQTPRSITLTAVSAICTGGTNTIGQLQEYAGDGTTPVDCDSADWTITTSEYTDSSFSNATIDAGDWLGWKTTSASGTVSFMSLTFEYYEL